MPRWIEIPKQRVLEVSRDEFRRDFRPVDEKGEYPEQGVLAYRIIRQDGKVFKPASFIPTNGYEIDACYLEEL